MKKICAKNKKIFFRIYFLLYRSEISQRFQKSYLENYASKVKIRKVPNAKFLYKFAEIFVTFRDMLRITTLKAWVRSPSQPGPWRGPSRPWSAYLSYRHQFVSNRPKNWAPNISRAYLYKSDELFCHLNDFSTMIQWNSGVFILEPIFSFRSPVIWGYFSSQC